MHRYFILFATMLSVGYMNGQRALRELKSELSRFVLVGGDSVWIGSQDYIKVLEQDSDLVFAPGMRREWIDTLLIDRFEISNRDYRAFTDWVQDSMTRCIVAGVDATFWHDSLRFMPRWDLEIDWENEKVYVAIMDGLYEGGAQRFYDRNQVTVDQLKYSYRNSKGEWMSLMIYPDTAVWNAFGYWTEPMTDAYYWHPAYDDYPVVGVTREQAEAYCHWRTKQLNAQLVKSGMAPGSIGVFRLPTADEWECAARPQRFEDMRTVSVSRLSEYYYSLLCGRNAANLGDVHDENMILVHPSSLDVSWYTSEVEQGYESKSGIRNMPGNVWEWVSDEPEVGLSKIHVHWIKDRYPTPSIPEFAVHSRESAEDVLARIFRADGRIDSLCTIYPEYRQGLLEGIETILHDHAVREKLSGGDCAKGGSWFHSTAAALPWALRMCPRNHKDALTGFRIVWDTGDSGIAEVKKRRLIKNLKR